MTKKTITITIPEELKNKIDEINKNKKGGKINISKICSTTLKKYIEKEEEKKITLSPEQIKKVRERLLSEIKKGNKEYYDIGFSMGWNWATTAHYESIKEIVVRKDEFMTEDLLELFYTINFIEDPEELFNEHFRCFFFDEFSINYYVFNDYCSFGGEHPDSFDEQHRQGWIDGVCKFWEKVKDII